jgi:C4-type Zn-finger protein
MARWTLWCDNCNFERCHVALGSKRKNKKISLKAQVGFF